MEMENPLLRRAYLYLEEGQWGKADDYCEKVLDQEPENASAYVIKLMARLKVDEMEKLGKAECDYEQWNSYCNAYRFADDALKQRLQGYLRSTRYHIEETERCRRLEQAAQKKAELKRKRELTYKEGLQYAHENATIKDLKRARQCFLQLQSYADAKERAAECAKRIAEMEKKQQLSLFFEESQEKRRRRKKWLAAVAIVAFLAVVGVVSAQCVKLSNVQKTKQISKNLAGISFSGTETDIIDSTGGGSFSLVREMTEYSRTFTFYYDGTVMIRTVRHYDKEPFLTKNGEREWDSTQNYEKIANWGQVEISLGGEITVLIDGSVCELAVSGDNKPLYFVKDGITYTVE